MASEHPYQAVDAVISPNFSLYSSSASPVRNSDPTSEPGSHPAMPSPLPTERDGLLGGAASSKKPFYRPRPLWCVRALVPFAVIASVVRGMTLAPRVQVYTQLSCNAVYGHDGYNHTVLATTLPSSLPHASNSSDFAPTLHASFPDGSGPDSAHSIIINFENDDNDEPDPRSPPSERCLKDSEVTARAASLQTLMTVSMGVLSAFTTSWWGTISDTYGRTRVLAIATLGLFMTDLVFILVSTPHSIFAAHGHKFLIVSPIIEGLCGGWATLQATTSAYISDCTSDGSRSHIFSRFTGVFYLGFAVGPMLGAFLIRHPIFPVPSSSVGMHNGAPTVTSVFYVAATASLVNLLFALFLFPESLTKKQAKVAAAAAAAAGATAAGVGTVPSGLVSDVATQSSLVRLLGPLAILLPKTVTGANGTKYRDWNMTMLALVLLAYMLSLGLFQIKYLYAGHIYGWGAEQLSYYISTMGFSRALHLLFMLPFLIAIFKRKPKPGPVHGPSANEASAISKEMHFDMALIRGSLFIDFCSHTLVVLASPFAGPYDGQAIFVGATAMSSIGAGLVPAVNSLALCVMKARGETDTGKTFGAFSVLQAVGQMILGPIIFALVYSNTVANFPKTIFFMAAGLVFSALVFTFLLRPDAGLRPRTTSHRSAQAALSALEARVRTERHRGRSTRSKDIRQPSFGSSASSLAISGGPGSYGATGSSASASTGSGFAAGSAPRSGPSSAQ
ncbi:MFS general substrate transporter [Epithele typhae]|uniref:MFS general substrate transporter n=1 Tax=Epithele typhae TaxID=378194 RepID=UPI002008D9C9|nr:MFS general substrate transporter [Epithele typhae]KAH9933638.1 MFS general substrate transporter [Epithele typhae]